MKETDRKILPVGIENFHEIQSDHFYYIDKTGMIKDLIQSRAKVSLFTRPRRFGKSLNMSMLRYFFETGSDPKVFDGLEIAKEREICNTFMGKFPVVSISLKAIDARNYETAWNLAVMMINEEARRHQYLLDSGRLTKHEKELFATLLVPHMQESVFSSSLRILTELLHKHFGQQVVLLMDEYDAPLASAFANGYYDQMASIVRSLFGQSLKTNDSLKLAVLTGCLRITKESIFTGLNNLKTLSIQDVRFDEYFGFTDAEVRGLLEYYGRMDAYEQMKEWYDGYQFGNVKIYCPWDVVNYCDLLCVQADAKPQDYWSNTSSNDIIRHFIGYADQGTTKREIERLVAGEAVWKKIREDLTYQDLYSSIDHLWSILFTTGYLTKRGEPNEDQLQLVIPNLEIRGIFTRQIMENFYATVKGDGTAVEQFCQALKEGDVKGIEDQLAKYLKKTVSIRDTFGKKPMKENYYHGILMGLLAYKETWAVFSNRESGDGYSDILVEIEEEEIGIVIEVKYPDGGSLEQGCLKALDQMNKNRYEEQLLQDGMSKIIKYGMAFERKSCRVLKADDL